MKNEQSFIFDSNLNSVDFRTTLRETIVSGFDIRKMSLWVNRIISSTLQAMILTPFCIGIEHNFTTNAQKSIDTANNDNKLIIENIVKFIDESFDHLKKNFWEDKAKKEIEEKGKSGYSHTEWGRSVYNHLKGKYSWRMWLVASWDSDHAFETARTYWYLKGKWTEFYEKSERSAWVSSAVKHEKHLPDSCCGMLRRAPRVLAISAMATAKQKLLFITSISVLEGTHYESVVDVRTLQWKKTTKYSQWTFAQIAQSWCKYIYYKLLK